MKSKVLAPSWSGCEARKKIVEEALKKEVGVGVAMKKVIVLSSLGSDSLAERSDKNKTGGWAL